LRVRKVNIYLLQLP